MKKRNVAEIAEIKISTMFLKLFLFQLKFILFQVISFFCDFSLSSVLTTSRRDWHGNVHDNVNVFGLGRIDLLRCCCCCGRARTETCYCQYIHNMLL